MISIDTKISKELIIEAAWGILKNGGLDSLSMRNIANELGIKAATLYWYFPNKLALMTALSDDVTATAISKFTYSNDWQIDLLNNGLTFSRELRKKPYSADLIVSMPPNSEKYLMLMDRLLQIIDHLALSDLEKFYSISIFQDQILSFERDFLIQQNNTRSREQSIANIPDIPVLSRIFKQGLFRHFGQESMLAWNLKMIIDGINQAIRK